MKGAATAAGALVALASVPAVVIAIGAAEPRRDPTLRLASEVLVVSPGEPIVLDALSGTDWSRVYARVDGEPVAVESSPGRLEIVPSPLSAGGHLLRVGIVHRGDVRREVAVPLAVGPFVRRGAEIPGGVRLRVAPEVIDGGPGALAESLSRTILTKAPVDDTLGALRAAPLRIRALDGRRFALAGAAVFERGTLRFSVPLRFAHPEPARLSLVRAGGVSVSVDEGLLQVAREEGARQGAEVGRERGERYAGRLGGGLGAVAGWIAGRVMGPREAPRVARERLTRTVDRLLTSLSDAMRFPDRIPLGDHLPGIAVELRPNGPPTFDEEGGLEIALDVTVHGLPDVGPGPIAFDGRAPEPSGSGVVFHPSLVSSLLYAWAATGGLDRAATGAFPEPRRFGPLELRGLESRAPPLLERAPPGMIAWTLPDTRALTNLALDVRAFAGGTLSARLRADGGAVLARVDVHEVAVSCRRSDPHGVIAAPCLSDATAIVPDLPERISAALPELRLLEGPLADLARLDLTGDGALRLTLSPRALTIGAEDGAPSLAVRFHLEFQAAP